MGKEAAFGTLIKRDGVTIAQVASIAGPTLSVDTEDVTTHDSEDAFEEAVATVIRSGEITLEVIYDPAEATHKNSAGGFLHDLISRQAVDYSIDLPTTPTATFEFSAFVIGFDPEFSVEGALRASVTLKPTGAITTP